MKQFISEKQIFFLLISLLGFISCTPQKKLTYFQSANQENAKYLIDSTYNAIIQTSDILNLSVASLTSDAAKYFSFNDKSDNINSAANGYLVDRGGNIQLPIVGDVHVAGLSTNQARDTIKNRLEKYLINPTVKLNIGNFRVTILGEVGNPGVYSVQNEKMTLTEVLAMAHDLTIFSVRKNVMVIREIDGKKVFATVDITSRDFFSSPYYNLHANDIIYVEASGYKRFQLGSIYFQAISVLASLLSVTFIIINSTK